MQKPIGKYAVPEEIRALKPHGTTVKNIKGHYYVYEHKRVLDEKTHRKKNATGKYLGVITLETGFVPKPEGDGAPGKIAGDDVSILSFGEYALAIASSEELLERLKQHFEQSEAERLYCMALIFFVRGYTYIRDFKDVYEQSILSVLFPGLPMGEKAVRKFLSRLGARHARVERFGQSLVDDGSGIYALDGHVILSCSGQNDMTAFGRSYKKLGNSQQNYMVMFDVLRNRPVSCSAFDGGTPDTTAVKDLSDTFAFGEGTTFIVDAGFYSEDNIRLFSDGGRKYVILLPAVTKKHKQIIRNQNLPGEFVYKKGAGKKCRASLIRYREMNLSTGRRLIMFKDEEMNIRLRSEYRARIGADESHTEENYSKLKDAFGVIILETNMACPASEVYETYKGRWKIETFYNHVKNREDFQGTHKGNFYEIQGEGFLMVLEGMAYSAFMKKLQSSDAKVLRGKSLNECILMAAHLKISKHLDGHWYKNNIRKGVTELIEALGVDIDQTTENIENTASTQ